MKRRYGSLLLTLPVLAVPPRLDLESGWKCLRGNQPEYAAQGLDDAAWTTVAAGSPWKLQASLPVGEVAWYRLHFTLPAGLRQEDGWRGGVRLDLSGFGDCDQVFLNGSLIGSNGASAAPGEKPDPYFERANDSYLDQPRTYVLGDGDPRLRWDGENVLAVKVRRTTAKVPARPHPSLRLAEGRDVVRLTAPAQVWNFESAALTKTFEVQNTSPSRAAAGTFTWHARGTRGEVAGGRQELTIAPDAKTPVTIRLPRKEESLAVSYTFQVKGETEPARLEEAAPYLLTPPAPAAPRINGPEVAGLRPGRPFLFQVPVTGERPLAFSAKGLPAGLTLDPATGILQGKAATRGEWPVHITVSNARGKAERTLRLVVGDRLALTPPMGWNSWNCWGLSVSEERVMVSARAFVDKGLRDHGWSYINIDDGWEIRGDAPEAKREPSGRIRVNDKFPDMARLGRRLHDLGLHFGIYSSPGPLTCGGYTASYQHELDDARAYADWGIDYLKYDRCSYSQVVQIRTREDQMKPYRVMRDALDKVDRDIVYSLCQYGDDKVWEWGDRVGGQLWRTTGDIEDTWDSMLGNALRQMPSAPFAKSGNWNDPDMLVVGWVGWSDDLHTSRLTPDEQYTHISLWSLLSAPLLIGCDLGRLDPFTLNLLTNDEVLAVDQDPKGCQAVPRIKEGEVQVWVKELQDGHKAFGVFNFGKEPAAWKVDLEALGMAKGTRLRDLWRQKDLPAGTSRLPIPPHGVVLLKGL